MVQEGAVVQRVEEVRRIAADPASVALLLSGPIGPEPWAGAGLDVRAAPLRRTPIAFVSALRVRGPNGEYVTGTLTLGYAPGGEEALATRAVFRLDDPTSARGPALRALAAAVLDRLRAAAEQRSTAA